jgi:hypothetical protein
MQPNERTEKMSRGTHFFLAILVAVLLLTTTGPFVLFACNKITFKEVGELEQAFSSLSIVCGFFLGVILSRRHS